MANPKPILVTKRGASLILGKHRAVLNRLLLERRIEPAALLDVSGKIHPLFGADELMRAADFLRHSSAVPPALS